MTVRPGNGPSEDPEVRLRIAAPRLRVANTRIGPHRPVGGRTRFSGHGTDRPSLRVQAAYAVHMHAAMTSDFVGQAARSRPMAAHPRHRRIAGWRVSCIGHGRPASGSRSGRTLGFAGLFSRDLLTVAPCSPMQAVAVYAVACGRDEGACPVANLSVLAVERRLDGTKTAKMQACNLIAQHDWHLSHDTRFSGAGPLERCCLAAMVGKVPLGLRGCLAGARQEGQDEPNLAHLRPGPRGSPLLRLGRRAARAPR